MSKLHWEDGIHMPYRGPEVFSWRSMGGPQQSRAIAAVVLLAAGWGIGFFAGRMSAWLLPVTEPSSLAMSNVAQSAAVPSLPVARAAAKPQRPPSEAPTVAAASAPTQAESASASAPSTETAAAPAPQERSKNAAADQDDAHSRLVLVNPDWNQSQASAKSGRVERTAATASELNVEARYRDAEADFNEEGDEEDRATRRADEQDRSFSREALAKCHRRYNSFRESDGTYQPYGRRGRELCPYLYQAYGRLEDRR